MVLRSLLCLWFCALSFANSMENIHELLKTDPAAAEKALLEAVKVDDTKGQAALLLARYYNGMSQFDEAIDFGKIAVKHLPNSSEAHFEYAKAIRNKMQISTLFAMTNTGTYTEHLNKAIELDPNHLDPYLEKIGFLLNAPKIAGGSESKAKEMVEKAKAQNEVLGLRAELMIADHKKNTDEITRLNKALIEADPENEIHTVRYGIQLANQERYDEAISFFETTLDAHPAFLSNLYQLGRIRYVAEKDLKKAEGNFTKYIDHFPPAITRKEFYVDQDYAYWRRGLVRQKLGDKEGAHADFQKALELNPENDDAKKALKDM